MNIRKLFAILAGVSMVANVVLPGLANAATPDTELGRAYEWARSKDITTMPSYEAANMYGNITRAELAKMLSNWAMNVKGLTPDTSAVCNFTDTDSVKGDLHDFITTSCQLGLMGQGIKQFRPYDSISRAEFGTALSRALWGDKYNTDETPYYAKHLNALKEAGIMTQIANAESMKEVRGYVMLMLMRSEGDSICDDVVVKVTCAAEAVDGTYKDCPTVCREGENQEDAKSGDVTVSISEGDGYVVSRGVTSYIDTIDFKASENITLDSITLERFGYSTTDSVNQVWLEDADGNEITNRKSMSSTKDTVTLSIKKDYRNIGKEAHLTIGLTTANKNASELGKSIGFKVTDMESSAANVDLPTKDANLYDIIDYDGSEVLVQFKGTNKTYNVKEGDFYEVAKVRVRATNAAVDVNGLVLTNDTADSSTAGRYAAVAPALTELDLADFVDAVEVYADGKLVNNVKYSVKRDELNLSFANAINVAINKDVDISVKVSLKDFDDYGDGIRFVLEEDSDLKAVESKTNTVVKLQNTSTFAGKAYIFQGGKINLDGKKLSSPVKGAQGAEDVVFGEGEVTVGEAVNFDVTVNPVWKTAPTCGTNDDPSTCTIGTKTVNAISRLSIVVDKNEYEMSYDNSTKTFSVRDVEIDKDATIKFVADIADYEEFQNGEVQFKIGTSNLFKMAGARYESNNDPVGDIVGNITLYPIKVQAGEGTLKNTISGKTVQFKAGDGTVTKNIFEGTYSAKNQKVNLKYVELVQKGTKNWPKSNSTTDATFNVKIDGELVATLDLDDVQATYSKDAATDISEISLDTDKEVSVVVEAKINADRVDANQTNTYTLYLIGEDDNGAEAGTKSRDTADLKIVANEAMSVSTNSSMKTQDIVLTEKNQSLVKFIAKPANNASSAVLDDLVFTWPEGKTLATPTSMSADDFDVLINGEETKGDVTLSTDGRTLTVSNINQDVDKNGVSVELVYNEELAMGEYTTSVKTVNADLSTPKAYKRLALPFKFAVIDQKNDSDANQTEFKFDIQIDDDSDVSYISRLTFKNGTKTIADWNQNIDDGTTDTYYADDLEDATKADTIVVVMDNVTYTITKTDATYTVTGSDPITAVSAGGYTDLFKVTNSSKEVQVYAKS